METDGEKRGEVWLKIERSGGERRGEDL